MHACVAIGCKTAPAGPPDSSKLPCVHPQELATEPSARPDLPRSGHCAARLPGAEGDILVFGGYTETPDKQRAATNDAWWFSSSSQTWSKVQYAASSEGIPEVCGTAHPLDGRSIALPPPVCSVKPARSITSWRLAAETHRADAPPPATPAASHASPPSWCCVAAACGSLAAGTPASRAQRPS
jgi:hypothetical protein